MIGCCIPYNLIDARLPRDDSARLRCEECGWRGALGRCPADGLGFAACPKCHLATRLFPDKGATVTDAVETFATLWGTFSSDALVVTDRCDRCGRPLYADSCGDFWTDGDGTRHAVCMGCLRPEED